jgi:hypothetical protein
MPKQLIHVLQDYTLTIDWAGDAEARTDNDRPCVMVFHSPEQVVGQNGQAVPLEVIQVAIPGGPTRRTLAFMLAGGELEPDEAQQMAGEVAAQMSITDPPEDIDQFMGEWEERTEREQDHAKPTLDPFGIAAPLQKRCALCGEREGSSCTELTGVSPAPLEQAAELGCQRAREALA